MCGVQIHVQTSYQLLTRLENSVFRLQEQDALCFLFQSTVCQVRCLPGHAHIFYNAPPDRPCTRPYFLGRSGHKAPSPLRCPLKSYRSQLKAFCTTQGFPLFGFFQSLLQRPQDSSYYFSLTSYLPLEKSRGKTGNKKNNPEQESAVFVELFKEATGESQRRQHE